MLKRVMLGCVVATLVTGLAFVVFPSAIAEACRLPPIIIVYGPTPGGGVVADGSSQVTAEVKNNEVAVEMVLFMVDGALVAVSKTANAEARYAAQWNTTKAANGEHKLRAAAVLADGSVLNSETVSVVVKNEPVPEPKQ